MILFTRAFVIRVEITRASSWSGYSSSPDMEVISGSQSCLDLFSTAIRAYALHAEVLSPPEAGPLTMTSICFSMGPFWRGEESLGCRPSGADQLRGISGGLGNDSSVYQSFSLGFSRVVLGAALYGSVTKAVVGFGQVLNKKFSSNSFAKLVNEEIEDGLNRGATSELAPSVWSERPDTQVRLRLEPRGWLADRLAIVAGVPDLTSGGKCCPSGLGRDKEVGPPTLKVSEATGVSLLGRSPFALAAGALATSGPSSSAKNVVELYVVAEVSAQLDPSCLRKVVRVSKCWGWSSGEVSKRVPFLVPRRGFYTCRPVIIRTSALTAVGILERGGCTASPSTEASYTRSAVGGGVHDILYLWVLQLGCWRGTLVNTTTSVNHCTSSVRRVARSTGDVPSVALVAW
ncbi:hypothetical protein BHE74_00034157 [Ensete ventricosum]|nr:hypothetical protein BHE74_00034157 [Ensete ventricosum]